VSLLLAVCDLFFPMITRNMINVYIPNSQLQLLITWGVILLLIYAIKIGFNYFVNYYGHVVGVGMQQDMRRDIFDRLQNMPFKYFDNNKTGTIMSRIINDLMDISELAHHGPEDLFLSVLLFIGSFVLLAGINLWLTLIMFIVIPFLIWFSMVKRVQLAAAFAETRKEIGEVNANLENSIAGIRISKAYTNKEYENNHFEEGNNAFVRSRMRAYKVMAEFFSGTTFMTDLLYVIVIVSGGLFTYYELITFGDFTAFLLFTAIFLNPIRRLINFIEQFQNGMSGFKRFIEIMDAPIEEDDPEAITLEKVEGDIKFENVTFSYDENTSVLTDVSLKIPKGNTVALVGPSGGGKTTLCHIIPRFYELDGGTVYLDGQDITKLTRKSLRQNIGIVAQDVFLFTGTIYENIAYGCPGAESERVYEAAKRANIHEFIMTLPDGYQTFVGERGVKLSGGQKQRVSIARVFLKDPPVLILDEATSSLDNTTELMIQHSLEELCKGRTTLVVAHRLSTVKNADEIIVITDEGIKEQGTHEELLDNNGLYAELYNAQFRSYTN
ncbi:MAG: ABC transporter ATP-binding protein/permease, partial [Oscillospiraceae bacterium]|nr:ABC transporter ATP-binding protein/permease [Oscillospiraceae bacterium]